MKPHLMRLCPDSVRATFFSKEERRVLLISLRSQEYKIQNRIKVITVRAKRGTLENLMKDLLIIKSLIATLQQNKPMNLHITDREQQVLKAALESQRSRKHAVVEKAPGRKQGQPPPKGMTVAEWVELRQPDNEYDILVTEHTLMHTISMLSKLTGQPPTHFMNPNPSQDKPVQTHDEAQHPKSNP